MDMFHFDPPDLAPETVVSLATEYYGVTGRLRRLRGERSHNTRITTADGDDYVLRVTTASEDPATVEFQVGAMLHIVTVAPGAPIARIVPARDGSTLPIVELDGRRHPMRLETYLPGVTFDDDQFVSLTGMRAIGSLVGRVSAALASFDHPASRHFMPWDIANGLILDAQLHADASDDIRGLVAAALPRLRAATAAISALPRQVIHNDGHGGNLLRADASSDTVTGMIDFGDLVHTVTVADLAVSGANFAPHQPDPPAALAALVAGFHEHRPLSDDEIAALADLVLARIVLSNLLVDYQVRNAPHIAAEVAREQPGLRSALSGWLEIEPRHVAERVREEL